MLNLMDDHRRILVNHITHLREHNKIQAKMIEDYINMVKELRKELAVIFGTVGVPVHVDIVKALKARKSVSEMNKLISKYGLPNVKLTEILKDA